MRSDGIPVRVSIYTEMEGIGMDTDSALWCVQLAVMAAVLLHAAYSDAVSRRASDLHWVVMCSVCIPVVALRTGEWVCAAGCAAIALYVLSPGIVGVCGAVLFATGSALCAAEAAVVGDAYAVSPPLLAAFFWMLYRAGMLAGGADAKCLMAVSLVLPAPVGIGHLLLPSSVLPPVLPVVATALALSLLVVPSVLHRSGWTSVRSYIRPIGMVDPVREAPVQMVVGGCVVSCRPAIHGAEEVLRELEAAGVETVEVTPLVPFLVPIAAAFLAVTLLGDPFSLIGARGPGRLRIRRMPCRRAPTGP